MANDARIDESSLPSVEMLLDEIKLLKLKISLLTETHDIAKQVTGESIQSDVLEHLESLSVHQLEFAYMESVDMYYHYKTGYYFHDETCLFFDVATKCYLKFNPRTGAYLPAELCEKPKDMTIDSRSEEKNVFSTKMEPDNDAAEDNEQPSKFFYDQTSGYFYNTVTGIFFEPVSRRYFKYDNENCSHYEVLETGEKISEHQPSLDGSEGFQLLSSSVRFIVLESATVNLGTLFVATPSEQDVIIGTDKRCSISLPSYCKDGVEPFHLKLRADSDNNKWIIRAVSQTCQAILNAKELENKWTDLKHGVHLEIGTLKLAVHIHSGFNVTCDGCEPALVEAFFNKKRQKLNDDARSIGNDAETNGSKGGIEAQRRMTNQRIKESLGIDKRPIIAEVTAGYEDKAAIRRQTVGSEPSIGYCKETKQTKFITDHVLAPSNSASTEKPIDSNNIGFKMLKSMGYNEGEGLGKEQNGIKQPIKIQIREPRAGLSCQPVAFSIDDSEKATKYHKQWSKGAKRFAQMDKN